MPRPAARVESAPVEVSLAQARAWRVRRHLLGLRNASSPTERSLPDSATGVVRRLAGVQAQVPAAAALALSVRLAHPAAEDVQAALARGELIRTWAMRGTLHLLHPGDAASYLCLVAASRSWEKGAWQRVYLSSERMQALEAAVARALDGPEALTREQLAAEVVKITGDVDLEGALSSGWGSVLKPIAWHGLLCQGPPQGSRVTFTTPQRLIPGWTMADDPIEAAQIAIPAFLGAHGPADAATFDQWLTRGGSRRAELRSWWSSVRARMAAVVVEGREMFVMAEHLDELAASRPDVDVHLLPAFDQFVLGPGTSNTLVLAERYRSRVSRAAGWIAPVVLVGGEVAGTWELDGGTVTVTMFSPDGQRPSKRALAAALARLEAATGISLTLELAS